MEKKICVIIGVTAMLLVIFTGCNNKKTREGSLAVTQNDIVILYTNDVHCRIEDNIGYAGLAAYKKMCMERTPYVTLVDCGDAVEGELFEKVSRRENLVDIMSVPMNKLGYDLAVLGNHEFDAGMDNVKRLLEKSDAQYLGCNIRYTGKQENKLSGIKSYEIIEYGGRKVGFVGVSTPKTVTKKRTPYLEENGKRVYYFSGRDAKELYQCVQQNVDECREKGADYVILLSHLGDDHKSEPFTSVGLIQHTTRIDVVLDAHSHSTIRAQRKTNEKGEEVLLSSTGNGMEELIRQIDSNMQKGT